MLIHVELFSINFIISCKFIWKYVSVVLDIFTNLDISTNLDIFTNLQIWKYVSIERIIIQIF